MSTRPRSSVAALLAASCLVLIALLHPLTAGARSTSGQLVGKIQRVHGGAASNLRAFAAATRRPGARPAKAAKGPAGAPGAAGPVFGAHVDGDIYTGNLARTDALQAALGRRIQIAQWYQSWGGNAWVRQLHPELIKAVTDSGRTPLLTWEPWNAEAADTAQPQFSLARLASGAYDDYITSWADGLKATGTTVYLRPMHEMNGNWYPWGTGVNGNTPAQYKAAWRHIVDLFRARGATNVKWVWCPLVDNVPDTRDNQLERYYPGAAYVDVLALDGYNWGADQPANGGWRSFSKVFGDAYRRLTRLGSQPIWIAEVGSASQGGDKAAWVRDMWKVAARMDRLKAIVWFDVDKEEDWRADTSPAVASAFRAQR